MPHSGCNQDHIDNLTRLTSVEDTVSCFYFSQTVCGTGETGPLEVYKTSNYICNKIIHCDSCLALSNANLHVLLIKYVSFSRVFCGVYGQRLEVIPCVSKVAGKIEN